MLARTTRELSASATAAGLAAPHISLIADNRLLWSRIARTVSVSTGWLIKAFSFPHRPTDQTREGRSD